MITQELATIFLLSHEQRRQLLSLVRRKVSHFLHVDAEGEEELLFEIDNNDMIVVKNLAEIMKLLKTSSNVIRRGFGICQYPKLPFPVFHSSFIFLFPTTGTFPNMAKKE